MLLRRYVIEDAAAMYKNWASDEEVTKYLTWPAHSSQDISRMVIEAVHDPGNPYSGAVMKKCGMKDEGTLRSSGWNNQGVCDACYYALLKSER